MHHSIGPYFCDPIGLHRSAMAAVAAVRVELNSQLVRTKTPRCREANVDGRRFAERCIGHQNINNGTGKDAFLGCRSCISPQVHSQADGLGWLQYEAVDLIMTSTPANVMLNHTSITSFSKISIERVVDINHSTCVSPHSSPLVSSQL